MNHLRNFSLFSIRLMIIGSFNHDPIHFDIEKLQSSYLCFGVRHYTPLKFILLQLYRSLDSFYNCDSSREKGPKKLIT